MVSSGPAPAYKCSHFFNTVTRNYSMTNNWGTNIETHRKCDYCRAIQVYKKTFNSLGYDENTEIVESPNSAYIDHTNELIKMPMTDEEMIESLKDKGYQFEDGIIIGPLTCPEGQILVEQKHWENQMQLNKDILNNSRKVLIVAGVAALLDVILLVWKLIG